MTIATHPGLRLTATENADGSWNILDVPILPPVPKGVRFNDQAIGMEWMRKTLDAARVESELGHLGSLSVFHHPNVDMGPQSKPGYGGKILPTRIGTSQMRDEGTVPCLFVDFLFMPPSVVDRIESGELSYRSPEVKNWAKFRVDTVSLLSTEPPFFRLPMLGIGERIPFDPGAGEMFETEEAFAVARFSDGPPPIYRFSEGVNMPDDEKKKDGGKPPKDVEEADAKMEDGINAETVIAAIESGEISIGDFDLILAAIAARQGETSEPEAEEEATLLEDEKKVAAPPVAFSDAKTAAQLTALEDFKQRSEQKELVAERIQTATAKFTEAGIQPSPLVQDRVAKFAATGTEDFFNEVVDLLVQEVPSEPAPTFAGAVSRAVSHDDPVVAKFADGDPEKLMEARRYSKMYDNAQARGWGLESTREEFITSGFRRQAEKGVR